MIQDTRRYVSLVVVAALVAAVAGWAGTNVSGYREAIKATPLLRTSQNTIGQAIEYPKSGTPEVTALLVEIPPGQGTGWHKHPVPIFAYVLAGTLTVEFASGERHEFHQGQALAEAVETPHNGFNAGDEPVKLVVFAMGVKDVPVAVQLNEQ
jgi:quercetin dioxygenase-like cupin family protein